MQQMTPGQQQALIVQLGESIDHLAGIVSTLAGFVAVALNEDTDAPTRMIGVMQDDLRTLGAAVAELRFPENWPRDSMGKPL